MFGRPHLTPGSAMLSVAALARMPRRSACENRKSSDISTVFAGVDEYQHAGYQLGITAQFVLVYRALLPAARPRRHWSRSITGSRLSAIIANGALRPNCID
jgi:hypothetical protein